MKQPRIERLIVLFIAGVLLFNYPLLSLFSTERMLGGVPLLFMYVFGAWAGFIIVLRLLLGPSKRRGR